MIKNSRPGFLSLWLVKQGKKLRGYWSSVRVGRRAVRWNILESRKRCLQARAKKRCPKNLKRKYWRLIDSWWKWICLVLARLALGQVALLRAAATAKLQITRLLMKRLQSWNPPRPRSDARLSNLWESGSGLGLQSGKRRRRHVSCQAKR